MIEDLKTTEDADRLLHSDTPAWVCKHSITCPISTAGHSQFEQYLADHPDHPAGLIVVQHARDVSNHVADATGVKHQSPQVLLVKDGRALWHASHYGITVKDMAAAYTGATD